MEDRWELEKAVGKLKPDDELRKKEVSLCNNAFLILDCVVLCFSKGKHIMTLVNSKKITMQTYLECLKGE